MSDPESDRTERQRPDEEEGAKPTFKVIDRRRFAPDGSDRAEDAAPAEEPGAAAQAAAKPARAGTGEAAAASSGPELATPKGEPYGEREPASFEATFGTLLISLSTQALMYLGEIPDLQGGESQKDLAAARNIIDLIAVLERKTAGNLDTDESALLERILYDLRMRFVEISRG
jgi:hypothetical protein